MANRRKPASAPAPSDGRHHGYARNCVRFVTEVLSHGGLPYPKQEEIFRLAARHRRVSVVGCNGSGKDWAAARIVLWWVETRAKAKAVVTGPTQRQVEEVVWREMRMAHGMARDQLQGQMYTSRYVVGDDRFALGFATDSAYNLQGFHSPNLLVVVTEAHAVEQQHMEALKRLNPKLLLLTGNPLTMSGEFYDSHHGRRALYSTVEVSAFDTPNLIEGRDDAVPGMLTPDDVEERKLEWGEDNPLYRASILGQFPESLEDTLIPLDGVRRATERWHASAPSDAEPWFMGVDVARFGADKTVLCLRRGVRLEEMHQISGADTMQVVGRVVDLARRHGVRAIFVDGAGVGGGVVDRLRELGEPVVDVQVGASAQHKTRFANLRAELFWGLRERFRRDVISIPDDPELAGQLVALRYDYDSIGHIKIEGKPEMRSRGLPSPDKADALALAFMRAPSLGVWI